jgi:malonyl-CoA O-methyltransferase
MSTAKPPTIDPNAAQRWAHMLQAASPWLHEEVARRMQERLQWMTLKPPSWVHWGPLRGGLQAHQLIAQRYPKSECFVLETHAERAQIAIKRIAPAWWDPARWVGPKLHLGAPAQPVQMVWANMALHMSADPQALLAQWSQLLEPEGFLMFSCLGPDTLRELRAVYAAQGLPPPSHTFTDMHDWGDMLVQEGFAEPVMDMERITLSFATPERLLAELRELGRNLHPQRFAGLRSRAWRLRLYSALQQACTKTPDGQLQLTFEIIYGHAFKPQPRLDIKSETTISLDAMRQSLRKSKRPGQGI